MKAEGYEVVNILVTPTELFIYCKENGIPINGTARAQYLSHKDALMKWRK